MCLSSSQKFNIIQQYFLMTQFPLPVLYNYTTQIVLFISMPTSPYHTGTAKKYTSIPGLTTRTYFYTCKSYITSINQPQSVTKLSAVLSISFSPVYTYHVQLLLSPFAHFLHCKARTFSLHDRTVSTTSHRSSKH